MAGNFDFDDFLSDDEGGLIPDNDGDLGLSDDSDGLEDLDSGQTDTKAIHKTAIVAIICGILLIVVVFIVVNVINNLGNKPKVDTENQLNQSEIKAPPEDAKGNDNPQQNNVNGQPNNQTSQTIIKQTSDGWVEFSTGNEITFADDYIDSTFTVTSIKHYVKVVDSKSNILVKTVLSGALAGYIGTYDLEVPYTLGSQVSLGLSFDVTVQIGQTADGKSVVGEIKF